MGELRRYEMEKLPLPELKKLAEKQGVKKPGVGWPTCCPPDGNKADIIRALSRLKRASTPAQSSGDPPEQPARNDTLDPGSNYLLGEFDALTLIELKKLAEKQGVKKPGVGWPTCCPPD